VVLQGTIVDDIKFLTSTKTQMKTQM
jgi:hypothetical protein